MIEFSGLKSVRIAIPMVALFLLSMQAATAQNHIEKSASEILHDIQGLKSVGSALYLAAHPDDENTKMITYLSKEKQLQTAYLALTRGDGGQNLIGTEKGDALGVLRTQELLEARKRDGGAQYFSRAVDFGYSKNPQETFTKWERDEVLKDVVWVIRKVRPDIIVTRFPPDSRAGHGHHTASAMLAIQAQKAAKDPNFKFNDDRDGKYKPWEVKRVVWNTSIWWYRRTNTKLDESKLYKIDVGSYNPLLGSSYNSIASKARSQHRSQGFGDLIDRGSYTEYFEHLAGDSAKTSIFEGCDFSWYRFGNFSMAEKAKGLIQQLSGGFNPAHPERSIEKLVELKGVVKEIADPFWRDNLNHRIDLLIAQCAGMWYEVTVDRYYAADSDSITFTLNAIKRRDCVVKTRFVDFGEFTYHIEEPTELKDNTFTEVVSKKVRINAKDYGYTTPYWLKQEKDRGLFTLEDEEMIGMAEKRPFQTANMLFEVNDENIEVEVPITYKWEDRALGEQRRPFEIRPKVSINFKNQVLVAQAGDNLEVEVNLIMNTDQLYGVLKLQAPEGWTVQPSEVNIEAQYRGEILPSKFVLTPGKDAVSGPIKALVEEEGNVYNLGLIEVKHEHILTQVMMPEAKCQLVYIDVATSGQKVGYLMGAGDEVPTALTQLGYQVEMLDPENITQEVLASYETVVLGVRVYNTIDNIRNIHNELLKYAEKGGKVIAQYNTTYGLKSDFVGPYELVPSRERITDEFATLKILQPRHPVFNKPNKISSNDFDNWVQERGLYFPSEFSNKYTPLLQGNDQDESPMKGMLLVASYGKGQFVYTGLSFFRELPAGVPGAYRLFVNLVEY